jgi:acyl-CoA thioesterase FadM
MKKPLIKKEFLVAFGDADPQGILYHARIYNLAHLLLEEFWAAHQRGWNFWFKNPEWAVPLRHSEADYLAPLKVGERITGQMSIDAIGDSSVTLISEFFNAGKLAAVVKTVHVFVNRTTLQKISVPEAVRVILGKI